MIDDCSLDAEFEEVAAEHARLEASFHELQTRPKDVEAHRELIRQLSEHLQRIRDHVQPRGMRVPGR